MRREYKALLTAIFILLLGVIVLLVGLFEIMAPADDIFGLIIKITLIVVGSIFLIMGLIFVTLSVREQSDVLHKKKYKCAVCGAEIQIEVKFCNNCGAENLIRKEAFEKLEKMEGRLEKYKAKRSEMLQSTKRALTAGDKRAIESQERMVIDREREMRVKKTKLIIGSTHEGKLEWVKAQHFDLKRTIQEIADDLGESMIAVGKYIDEIENQDK